jgi:hypothetical protein
MDRSSFMLAPAGRPRGIVMLSGTLREHAVTLEKGALATIDEARTRVRILPLSIDA